MCWYQYFSGCEGKVAKVLSKTEEEQLQPFKDNMENFLRQANQDFDDTQEKLQNANQRWVESKRFALNKIVFEAKNCFFWWCTTKEQWNLPGTFLWLWDMFLWRHVWVP